MLDDQVVVIVTSEYHSNSTIPFILAKNTFTNTEKHSLSAPQKGIVQAGIMENNFIAHLIVCHTLLILILEKLFSHFIVITFGL